jgi:hypothetical protein
MAGICDMLSANFCEIEEQPDSAAATAIAAAGATRRQACNIGWRRDALRYRDADVPRSIHPDRCRHCPMRKV